MTESFSPGAPGLSADPDAHRVVDVLVVGDANPDLVLQGDVLPRFGQAEQLLESAVLTIGGSATIAACGLARLGLVTSLVACIGTDLFGDQVVSEITGHGVDSSRLRRVTGTPTGLSVILSSAADRAILTLPGTVPLLRAEHVTDDDLAQTGHVHVASYFLQPTLAAGLPDLLGRARAAGCTVSLDTNWDPAERWTGVHELLPLVDVLLPNIAELLALAGQDPQAPADPDVIDRAGRALSALGPLVACKAGAAGALGWGPDGPTAAPGLSVDVVDTTGAGDTFNAGFLWAWLGGAPFERCLRAAAVAGSLSTRGVGGTASQATAEELSAKL